MRAQSIGRRLMKAFFLPQLITALASPSPPFQARLFCAAMAAPAHELIAQKKALRSNVRRQLRAMTPSQRSHQDNAIQDLLLGAPWFKSCKILCAYINCESLREVNAFKILSDVLSSPAVSNDCGAQSNKKLYVPRVEDKNSHMRMLHIYSMEDLVVNSMNILEPNPAQIDGREREDVMQADTPVDLILLPGLAFDRTGKRLGRGGGYYDLFLTKYLERAAERRWMKPLLVALSYSEQIMEEGVIPVTPNDVPVDAIVSQDGIIRISYAAKGILAPIYSAKGSTRVVDGGDWEEYLDGRCNMNLSIQKSKLPLHHLLPRFPSWKVPARSTSEMS